MGHFFGEVWAWDVVVHVRPVLWILCFLVGFFSRDFWRWFKRWAGMR